MMLHDLILVNEIRLAEAHKDVVGATAGAKLVVKGKVFSHSLRNYQKPSLFFVNFKMKQSVELSQS
ncbi:hypothetical protein [Neolewinella agarilytica]|uniref:hypothetical protein n=1 Tax=Neolewinella agarilytica TaxID=478744 RepID=UPI002356353D|nr:hypothetical protein [Neolewinella agarilytica]